MIKATCMYLPVEDGKCWFGLYLNVIVARAKHTVSKPSEYTAGKTFVPIMRRTEKS